MASRANCSPRDWFRVTAVAQSLTRCDQMATRQCHANAPEHSGRSIEGGVPQAMTKDSTVCKKAVPQNRLAEGAQKGAIIAICGVMQVVRTKLSRLVEPSAKSPRYHPGLGGPGSLARHVCYHPLWLPSYFRELIRPGLAVHPTKSRLTEFLTAVRTRFSSPGCREGAVACLIMQCTPPR